MANVDPMELVKQARAKVEETRRRRAELEGRRKQLLEQLQREHGVSTLAEADVKLTELEADLARKTRERDAGVEELRELMETMR